jgi:hypothetical protein
MDVSRHILVLDTSILSQLIWIGGSNIILLFFTNWHIRICI